MPESVGLMHLLESEPQTEPERTAGGGAGTGHEVLKRIRDGPVERAVRTESQVRGSAAWAAPDGRVGEVSGFGAELGFDLFPDLEVPEQGRPELPVAGPPEGNALNPR